MEPLAKRRRDYPEIMFAYIRTRYCFHLQTAPPVSEKGINFVLKTSKVATEID